MSNFGEARLVKVLDEVIAAYQGSGDSSHREKFRLIRSIGDDAAAWECFGRVMVFTSDALVDGVHFDIDSTEWRDLGWKSIAVNLSDVAAMGCAPLYSVVTLGMRNDLPVEGLIDMYRGMLELSQLCGGEIVGGDMVNSPVFFVSIAMVGVKPVSNTRCLSERAILTRSAAKSGDKIAVTGNLGCSAGGLRIMRSKEGVGDQVSAHLINSHVRPMPRVSEGILLADHGVIAAIDISDGLVNDLGKICQASGVGALVWSGSVPIDEFLRVRHPEDFMSLALSGGEDYELLFTAGSEVMDNVVSDPDLSATVIGEIVGSSSGVKVLDDCGVEVQLDLGGWDHFPQDSK
mgnify:CR=1 FL=1